MTAGIVYPAGNLQFTLFKTVRNAQRNSTTINKYWHIISIKTYLGRQHYKLPETDTIIPRASKRQTTFLYSSRVVDWPFIFTFHSYKQQMLKYRRVFILQAYNRIIHTYLPTSERFVPLKEFFSHPTQI